MRQNYRLFLRLLLREMMFRVLCKHRQGSAPNICLYCTRRSGSTWLLNTVAAHPGMRYVGRPFQTTLLGRFRNRVPDLRAAAGHHGNYFFQHFIHFEGEERDRFLNYARELLERGRVHVYPTLRFWAPYFHRITDRVIFQITNATSLIAEIDAHLQVYTAVMLRHPIPTSLSVMQRGWTPEVKDFLLNKWFRQNVLSREQLDLASRIVESNDALLLHVLDWVFKMIIPLREIKSGNHPDWVVVTYEEMVVRPYAVLSHIAERWGLTEIDVMLQQSKAPSATVSVHTRSNIENVAWLLSRWRAEVSTKQLEKIERILQIFEVADVYSTADIMPSERFIVS